MIFNSDEKYYRYEGYSDTDYMVHIICMELSVIRKTKCCVYIDYNLSEKRILEKWNNGSKARKQFAYSNKEKALEAYKFRKQKQISILETNLAIAKAEYSIACSDDLTKSVWSGIMPKRNNYDY